MIKRSKKRLIVALLMVVNLLVQMLPVGVVLPGFEGAVTAYAAVGKTITVEFGENLQDDIADEIMIISGVFIGNSEDELSRASVEPTVSPEGTYIYEFNENVSGFTYLNFSYMYDDESYAVGDLSEAISLPDSSNITITMSWDAGGEFIELSVNGGSGGDDPVSYAGTNVYYQCLDTTSGHTLNSDVYAKFSTSDGTQSTVAQMTYDNNGLYYVQVPVDWSENEETKPYTKVGFYSAETAAESERLSEYEYYFLSNNENYYKGYITQGYVIDGDAKEYNDIVKDGSWEKYVADAQAITGYNLYIYSNILSEDNILGIDNIGIYVNGAKLDESNINVIDDNGTDVYKITMPQATAHSIISFEVNTESEKKRYNFTWDDVSKNQLVLSDDVCSVNETFVYYRDLYVDTTLACIGDNEYSFPVASDSKLYAYIYSTKEGFDGTSVLMSRVGDSKTFKTDEHISSNYEYVIFTNGSIDELESVSLNALNTYDYNPGMTSKLTIPVSLSTPCFYLDSDDDCVYKEAARGGFFVNYDANYIRDVESAKSVLINSIGNADYDDFEGSYITADIYDYYSDYELSGKVRSTYDASHDEQEFTAFNKALADYYSDNNIVSGISIGNQAASLSEENIVPFISPNFLTPADVTTSNSLKTMLGKKYSDVKFPIRKGNLSTQENSLISSSNAEYKYFNSSLDSVTIKGNTSYAENGNQPRYFLAKNEGESSNGFFPFDNSTNVINPKTFNFGFGADIEIGFQLTEDGTITDSLGNIVPLEFVIEADNQAAVYLDGEYVFAADGRIDFSTHKYTVDGGEHYTEFDLEDVTNHTITIRFLNVNTENSNLFFAYNFNDVMVGAGRHVVDSTEIAYGQKLSDIELNDDVFVGLDGVTPVEGTIEWQTDTDTLAQNVGDIIEAVWVFTPDDEELAPVTGSVLLFVVKAQVTIDSPTLSSVEYSATLTLSQLIVPSENEDGETDSNGNVWTVGSSTYNGESVTVPGIWIWGCVLKDSEYSFASDYNNCTDPILSTTGTNTNTIVFIPTDQSNYEIVERSVNVTATKVSPHITVITAPTASEIEYGSLIGSSQIDNTEISVVYENTETEIAGEFQWPTSIAGTVATNIGNNSISVDFVPDDTNYNKVTGAATINLSVIGATATLDTTPSIILIYGEQLQNAMISGGVVNDSSNTYELSGEWRFKELSDEQAQSVPQVSDSGTEYLVVFSAQNYQDLEVTVPLNVIPAQLTLKEAPTASAITFGSYLSASTVTGGRVVIDGDPDDDTDDITVTGTWSWSESTRMPRYADSNLTEYEVVFTPTDSAAANYSQIETNITVTVNKATPTIERVPTITTLYDAAVTLAVSGNKTFVDNGLVTFMEGATKKTLTGTWSIENTTLIPSVTTTSVTVTFTPTDTSNYTSVSSVVANLQVSMATPYLSVAPTVDEISFGTVVDNSLLNGGTVLAKEGGTAISGTWSFAAGDIGAVPDVASSGVTEYTLTFTPADTTNYTTITTTITLAVEKADLIINSLPGVSGITYGQTLADSTFSGGTVVSAVTNGAVAGTWSYKAQATAPAVSDSNTTEYAVVFTPTDTANYNTVESTVKVTVNKAGLTISTLPSGSGITYGQTLAGSTLSGGAVVSTVTGESVAGSFSYVAPATMPSASDSNVTGFAVRFTPQDTANYNTVTEQVKITVNRAIPVIVAPQLSTIFDPSNSLSVIGTTQLVQGGSARWIVNGEQVDVAGTWSFKNAAFVPMVATDSVVVVFTPNDTVNYVDSVETTADIVVSKATPYVEELVIASGITYGQTLAASVLSGGVVLSKQNGSVVSGTWSYKAEATAPAVSDSNTTQYAVVFTPTDTANYNTVESTVTVKVSKATLTVVTVPSASAITYGQTLGDSILSGGSVVSAVNGEAVAGTWRFGQSNTKPSVIHSNETSYGLIFTPDDTDNYMSATGKVQLTIQKAPLTINSLPSTSAITYGQTLADSTFSGGVVISQITNEVVEGTWSYKEPTTVPNVSDSNSTQYVAVFTPTNTADYNTVEGQVKVAVSKADLKINTKPGAGAITYGQTLASSTLSTGKVLSKITGNEVTGTWSYKAPATVPKVSDSNSTQYEIVFTPDDTVNYNTIDSTAKLRVDKAGLTINTLPTVGAITYGQKLESSTLSGGAVVSAITGGAVAGTWSYKTPTSAPKVSDSNVTEYTVVFTPNDTSSYNKVEGKVKVTVNKAGLTINTLPTVGAITYGQKLESSTLSSGAVVSAVTGSSVTGTWSYKTKTTVPKVSDSNTTEYTVVFTPNDTANYNKVEGKVKVTVNKAGLTINTLPAVGAITYGQTLEGSTFSGGAVVSAVTGSSVTGTWSYKTKTTVPKVSDSNSTEYVVVFTPSDIANYNTVEGKVKVAVNKAGLTISTLPSVGAITYGQTLESSTFSGGAVVSAVTGSSVTGTWSYKTKTTVPKVSDSNSTEYVVVFTPSDTASYNTVEGKVKVTINKAGLTISTLPSVGAITYGQKLESSTFSGGAVVSAVTGSSVTGTWSYKTKTTVPKVSDSNSTEYVVVFTPSDTASYNTVEGKVKVTVNKAGLTISTLPTAGEITSGQTLAESTLSGGAVVSAVTGGAVDGTWIYKESDTAPKVNDSNTTEYEVLFTPTDTANYNTAEGKVQIVVNKATLTTLPQSEITFEYGKYSKIGDILLLEKWSWDEQDAVKAPVEGEGISATAYYTSDDRGEYDNESIVITVTMLPCEHTDTVIKNKVDPTCTKAGYMGDTYCNICGRMVKQGTTIKATGHSFTKYTSNNDATCTKDGTKTAICDHGCGTKKTITDKGTAKGHSYVIKVTAKATVSKEGTLTTCCKVCGSVSNTTKIHKIKSAALSKTVYYYTGKAIKPAVTVKDDRGIPIDKKFYTVSYNNNINVGTATVTITFKDRYAGTLKRTFNIKPKKTTLTSLTKYLRGMKAVWSKVTAQTTGYHIQYSTTSTFKTGTVKTFYNKNTVCYRNITPLEKGKTYYVRVRTYKNVVKDGKTVKVYSDWSNVRSIKLQ